METQEMKSTSEEEKLKADEIEEHTATSICNEILSHVQNIDNREEAYEKAESIIDELADPKSWEYDRRSIYKEVSEIDSRFIEKYDDEVYNHHTHTTSGRVVCPQCQKHCTQEEVDIEDGSISCNNCDYTIVRGD